MGLTHRLILLGLVVFGQGMAQAQWTQPLQIGISPAWGQVSAESNAHGDAVLIYNRMEYGEGTAPNQMWIEANTRCNGEWGTPQRISVKTDATNDNQYVYPKAAIDSYGFSYALWKYTDGNQEGLKNAICPSPCWPFLSQDFPMAPADKIDQYEIAHNAGLWVTAVWSTERSGNYYVESAQFDRMAHGWNAIQPISLLSACKSLDVKVDSQGVSWLIWSTYSYTEHKDLVYITSMNPESKQWNLPQILTKGQNIDELKLSIDPKDNVYVRWQQQVNQSNYLIQIYKKQADTLAWIKTEFPVIKNTTYPYNQFTFDQKGNALLLWEQTWENLRSTTLSARGINWSAPKLVVGQNVGSDWSSAIDKKGNRLLVYTDDRSNIQFMTLPVKGTQWSTPIKVAEQAYSNDPLFHVGLSKDTAIIIYADEQDIKVVEGGSLFQPLNLKKF